MKRSVEEGRRGAKVCPTAQRCRRTEEQVPKADRSCRAYVCGSAECSMEWHLIGKR